MINFEPKYVYCFWNNILEGKKGFFADTMGDLKSYVESNDKDWFGKVYGTYEGISYPFTMEQDDGFKESYQFCYYDPLYEYKIAYEEGKTIQIFSPLYEEWKDCENRPLWNTDCQYRIKPNDDFHVVYNKSIEGFSVDNVEIDADEMFFNGTEKDCFEWIKSHKDLEDVIKAYYNDKTIQYFEHGMWLTWNLNKLPLITTLVGIKKWRIKPTEEKKFVPFKNTQELIECWEKKCPTNKDRPKGTMPLIWVIAKNDNESKHLITDFFNEGVGVGSTYYTLSKLFKYCLFIDGSVCGKSEQEEE